MGMSIEINATRMQTCEKRVELNLLYMSTNKPSGNIKRLCWKAVHSKKVRTTRKQSLIGRNSVVSDAIWHSCMCCVIRYFHPRHNGQWPPTSKDFYTRSYPFHYFLILFLEKEPAFPFSMLSAKQGNYWYHFYNVFGMTRSLTGDWTRDLPHSKPALYHKAIEEAVVTSVISSWWMF